MDWSLAIDAAYFAIGAFCLRQSHHYRDLHGIGFGILMLSTWLVSMVAVGMLPHNADVALIPITSYDAIVAIFVGAMTPLLWSVRGAVMFGMFGVEMLFLIGAAVSGMWATRDCFLVLNLIWVVQVLIAGWPGVVATVYDWNGGRGFGARAYVSRS